MTRIALFLRADEKGAKPEPGEVSSQQHCSNKKESIKREREDLNDSEEEGDLLEEEEVRWKKRGRGRGENIMMNGSMLKCV